MSAKNKKCVVKISGNLELADLLFLFLKDHGCPNLSRHRVFDKAAKETSDVQIRLDEPNNDFQPNYDFTDYYKTQSCYKNYIFFDAATEFGKIVEFFNKPDVPEIFVKNEAGGII